MLKQVTTHLSWTGASIINHSVVHMTSRKNTKPISIMLLHRNDAVITREAFICHILITAQWSCLGVRAEKRFMLLPELWTGRFLTCLLFISVNNIRETVKTCVYRNRASKLTLVFDCVIVIFLCWFVFLQKSRCFFLMCVHDCGSPTGESSARSVSSVNTPPFPLSESREQETPGRLSICSRWWWYYLVIFMAFRRNGSVVRRRLGLHAALRADGPGTSSRLQPSWKK